MRKLLSVLIAILILLYPLAIYFGLTFSSPSKLGVLLAGLFVLRLWVSPNPRLKELKGPMTFVALAGAPLALYSSISNTPHGFLFYPVVVNAILLLAFAQTLIRPPSMIERFARTMDPDFPDRAIPYTRKVTWIWCCFFICNGSIALYTALFSSLKTWSLYNGLISYLIMGAIFAIEFAVRLHLKKRSQSQ
ncbi:COG4648 family protein [Dongshaea marina]|uniref:COG4648 family protein n=1 Tax=Dongshaea marina TaxID=2047966 RepID=UPI000D3E0452|nr:hypothetical protein [Dongshaea marina]